MEMINLRKKRVLHIVNSLGQGSGVMSFIMNLYRNINHDRIQIDFIIGTKKEPNYEKEIIDLGGEIFHIPMPVKINYKNYLTYISKINSFFEENQNKYEIIHSHVSIINLLYFPIAKKNGIKHRIAHSHSTKSSSSTIGRIRNFFLLLPIKKQANIFFACSKQAGMFLFGKKEVEKGTVHILNNAIDCKKFNYTEELRSKVKKDIGIDKQFVVGHVGRFSKEKNHLYLIDIFYEILNVRKDSILLLIGDGKLMNTVKEKVIQLGISDNVIFLGVRKNIDELMLAMDVFVLPSSFEGLGIVAIEAQSVGLPCFVSNNVPEDVDITELVSHISLEKHPKYWAEKIFESINLRKNNPRKGFAREIKQANYDTATNAKWLEDFYTNLN